MARDDGKLKSARRKPLRDVSNGGVKPLKSAMAKKKNKEDEKVAEHEHDRACEEDPLDRLLLVHSDISSLLRQIDELVAQAVKVKTIDHKRREEIKSFTNVLSETHSSLMPSVLRLQKALGSCFTEPEIQLGETSVGASTVIDDDGDSEADTPEPTKMDSLVSPSPLVSWRVMDCPVETGKQLFLLTPLPRPRTSMSKAHVSSKPTPREGITMSTTFWDPSLCAETSKQNHDVAESVEPNHDVAEFVEPNHDVAESFAKNLESTSDSGSASPPKVFKGDFSMDLTTPCLKNPPRSCVLLEPDCVGKINKPRMSTPFPVGNKKLWDSTDSDSSSGEVSEKLGFKYPELIGIKPSMLRNGNKALEASPAWITSPPKYCTLLEPPDEKPVKNVPELAGNFKQQVCLATPRERSIQINNQDQERKQLCIQGNLGCSFATVESTPLWKGCGSTIQQGKRPGENTLKKELWTRFEAASMGEYHLNSCVLEDTSQKGFLDRLEEASCDEASPHPDSLR